MNNGKTSISRTEDKASAEFLFADGLGPLKCIHVYEPSAGLRGILVVDNVAIGPSIGGLRIAPDVSTEECFRLARAMTFKNASAGLPHGGGKSVIFGDPAMPAAEKERLIRTFAAALRNEQDYIFGPDMGTNETCMAWVKDEIGRAVGLPREIGGIALGELGATGYGLASAAEVAAQHCDVALAGARIAVQGFGSVGQHGARFLVEKGGVLVAAGDSGATVCDPAGLDLEALVALKQEGGSLGDYGMAKVLPRDAVIETDCDILIPAARPDVINAANADAIKARLILQGANLPATSESEEALHGRGVLVIPDFIANAGGVICAAMEYAGSTQTAAFAAIAKKIAANTREILEIVKVTSKTPRAAAKEMASRRVEAAMGNRRFSVF